LRGKVEMILLHSPRRSSGFLISSVSRENQNYPIIKHNAKKLLIARGDLEAAAYLEKIPFKICDAISNGLFDELYVLCANVPLELYEELRVSTTERIHFGKIANVISEIGPFISYVGVEIELTPPDTDVKKQKYDGLKDKQIDKLVYGYIGVSGGYLGDFSYRSHHQFYLDLELDIDPYKLQGTTREKFIQILKTNPPLIQAKILRGILNRYPVGSLEIRTQEKYDEIRGWVEDLQTKGIISLPNLQSTSDIVLRALGDADQLITSRGAVSGVDRMHTALHGYIRAVCQQVGIKVNRDANVTELFKVLRENHPAFKKKLGSQSEDIIKVLRALATVIDALNPIRNRASVAHPNESLLDEPEAVLIINAIRTLLQYIESRINNERETMVMDEA